MSRNSLDPLSTFGFAQCKLHEGSTEPNEILRYAQDDRRHKPSTTLIALAAIVCFGFATPSAKATDTSGCVECHSAFEDSPHSPTKSMDHDVHFKAGLSCVDCHGGDPKATDPDAAKDPKKGFIGKPARKDIPQFCARCHADVSYMRKYNPNLPVDQHLKYLSSEHGKRNSTGDKNVAVCSSCHGAHGIRSKKDPQSPVYPTNIPGTCAVCHSDTKVVGKYNIPVTQHWEYAQSVHGQALLIRGDRAAPHCASCHGSHEAAKPGTTAVGNVCAQCHSLTRDLFAKSPHKKAHEEMGLPECEVCHGNHLIAKPSDAMLGTDAKAVCSGCHVAESKGYKVAAQMRNGLEEVKSKMAKVQDKVTQATNLGMDVSDAIYELGEAESKLTQARTYVHSFSWETMKPIIDESTEHVQNAEKQADSAIKEFGFRRHGLWITLGILALLVGGLLWLIKEQNRPK